MNSSVLILWVSSPLQLQRLGRYCPGRSLLPDKVAPQQYCNLCICSTKCAWRCPSSCEVEQWSQHVGTRTPYREDVWKRMNATYPGSWIGRGGKIARHPPSLDIHEMNFSCVWRHPKEHVYAFALRTAEELVARFHAALVMVPANALRGIQENVLHFTAKRLAVEKGPFEHLL